MQFRDIYLKESIFGHTWDTVKSFLNGASLRYYYCRSPLIHKVKFQIYVKSGHAKFKAQLLAVCYF